MVICGYKLAPYPNSCWSYPGLVCCVSGMTPPIPFQSMKRSHRKVLPLYCTVIFPPILETIYVIIDYNGYNTCYNIITILEIMYCTVTSFFDRYNYNKGEIHRILGDFSSDHRLSPVTEWSRVSTSPSATSDQSLPGWKEAFSELFSTPLGNVFFT